MKNNNFLSIFNILNISENTYLRIIERIEKNFPENEKYDALAVMVYAVASNDLLLQKNMTIEKMRKTLFPKTEKLKNILRCKYGILFGEKDDEESVPIPDDINKESQKKEKPKGHGKNSVDKFTNAEKVYHPLKEINSGSICPCCHKGKTYPTENGKILKILGTHLLKAKIHEVEKLRCNACGEIFSAQLPENVSKKRTDEAANAIVALHKYAAGFPFYRLEKFNKMMGVPISSSSLWEMCEHVADCIYPVHDKLIEYAGNSNLIHIDDTKVHILSVQREKKGKGRKGTQTTGVVAKIDDHEINLFFSGRNHAGENLRDILENRNNSLSPPIVMADASAMNFSKVKDITAANCNTHARRKFFEHHKHFPEECEYILRLYAGVFKNEKICRQKKLSDPARLKYHQQYSKLNMDEIKRFIEEQFDENKIEPHCGLGSAFNYTLKHWDRLIKFLEVEGCPIDNNISERILKKAILNRKNAMFFKNEHSAVVGDILMSMIFTADKAGVNPFEYLVDLQKHKSHVHKNAEKWLPWNYKETLKSLIQIQKAA